MLQHVSLFGHDIATANPQGLVFHLILLAFVSAIFIGLAVAACIAAYVESCPVRRRRPSRHARRAFP